MTSFHPLQKSVTSRKNRYPSGTLFFFVFIFFTSCSKHPGKQIAAVSTADEGYCRQDASSYNKILSEQFRRNDSTIMVLKATADLKKPQETPEFTRQLLVLEVINDQLKKNISHHRYTDKKEWLQFRKAFSGQLDELSASLSELGNWWN
jgi:hypothetical protein